MAAVRSSAARVAAMLMATVLMATVLMTAVPAAPTAATRDDAADTLTITDVSEPVLEVGDDLTLTIAYTNNGSEPVTVHEFDLFAQSSTAISDTSVYYWMDGVSPARFIASVPADMRVLPGRTMNHTFTIDREYLPWATAEFTWGPRGIEVRAVTDSDTVSDRTMIVAATDHPVTPYPATVVVPGVDRSIVADDPANILLSHDASDDDNADNTGDSSATAFVDSWDHDGVTTIADPRFPGRPATAERLSLPMYDADIAALADAGRLAQAQEFVDESVFLPASAPSLKTIEFAADLEMMLLIPDAVFKPVDALTYTPGALTTIALPEETPAIATHSAMSSALAGNLIVGDFPGLELDTIDSRQVAVALSAVHHRQRPNDPRPVAVVVKRDSDEAAREAALAMLDAPWIEPSSLSQIAGGERSSVKRAFVETDALLQGAISAEDLDRIEAGLAEFEKLAMVFEDGGELVAEAADRADRLLSIAWRSDPSGRNANIIGLAPTQAQMTAITVNTSSTINMISESSALPIQVTNEFTAAVDVVVHLDTPDIRLEAPAPVEVHLPASATATVSVPVEARGSGNVDVDVMVTNAAGDLVGSPDTLHVRVRADWENVGTVVIAGLVAAVFLIGLIRSIRDGRRSEPVEPDDFVAATRR